VKVDHSAITALSRPIVLTPSHPVVIFAALPSACQAMIFAHLTTTKPEVSRSAGPMTRQPMPSDGQASPLEERRA
jgi:hypothetical protein